MLADLLYSLIPYQIFKSVFFRGGMTYLTSYFLLVFIMPSIVRLFRERGIHSDLREESEQSGPYQGATPIMGGIVIIPSIVFSVLLWAWFNPYLLFLTFILISYSIVGAFDDIAKVRHKKRIIAGKEQQKSYTDKADGLSGKLRITLETVFALGGLLLFYHFVEPDARLYVPMVPIKSWFPELPYPLFVALGVFIIVGGSNAVNLTDGLDSLATVPILTCTFFAAAVAYISGESFISTRLKILFLSPELKEVAVFSFAILGACLAFLKFNSPPASIYMGDLGSLGLGAVVSAMFILVKAELYLPIVGGTFILAAISSILQRLWFKVALWKKGRSWAEKNRFFYRAPYHHHQQMLLTYKEQESEIQSILHRILKKLGIARIQDEDKYLSREQVNNKVIWSHHLRAVWLLVICMIIYFKAR